tara:strand:+ start:165 stop:410 length:246 start_codon:yes stop_codon:yes gene_type:complete
LQHFLHFRAPPRLRIPVLNTLTDLQLVKTVFVAIFPKVTARKVDALIVSAAAHRISGDAIPVIPIKASAFGIGSSLDVNLR